MPANKNALIRYKTIDNCLRNTLRRWTLEDLVDACSEALRDMEDVRKGISTRTVQADIQMMRSDKLGYNAPIEVYERKYYRYADKNYSINNMPMTANDYEVMKEAVDMLRQLQDFDQFSEMSDIISRLQEKMAITQNNRQPIIHFDHVADLKGLKLLNPLYNHIARKQTLRIVYQPFSAREPRVYTFHPYLLKEFRNRWFLIGCSASDMLLYNLALDRIVSIEPCDVPFQENPELDVQHFFDDVVGVSKNIRTKARKIRFWASREQSQYIKTKPLHASQQLVCANRDGSCEFEISVVINFELYSVFLSYGQGIKILSPRKCADYMKSVIKDMAMLYEK